MRTLSEQMSLKGRVALVAGGATAVGRAIADAYAELGAAVVILDQPESGAENVARGLTDKHGVLAMVIALDSSDVGAMRKVPQRVVDNCGRLDILVTVGSSGSATALEQWDTDLAQTAITADLVAPLLLTQQASVALRAAGKGAVIYVTGGEGLVSSAVAGGLAHLSQRLAHTLAPDVRVNAIIGGSAEDVRGAAIFLASDLALRMTGQRIVFGNSIS